MILLILFLYTSSSSVVAGCTINLEKVTGKFPPILVQNNLLKFPTSENAREERIINFDEGESLDLYCHSSSSIKNERSNLDIKGFKRILGKKNNASLVCSGGKFFLRGTQKSMKVEIASCSRKQEPLIKKTVEKCSTVGADGRKYDMETLASVSIGWNIGETYIEEIGLCIDEKLYGTIWTRHNVHGKNIDYQDKGGSRPPFRNDNTGLKRFFNWTSSTGMNTYYSKNEQVKTITSLLKTKNKMNKKSIIDNSKSGTNYFAKGHLAPDAAFIYDVMQDSTYYFMNVAPQFQSFNNGNWKALEMNTRDFAAKAKRDIKVHTGTYGILEYPDKNNNMVDIYLYNSDDTHYVPAPKYYWKVLQDPKENASVVFIGLNDPHATEPPKPLCTNRCREMSWVDWNVTELDAGYMYCCSLEEARRAIPAIPDIGKSSGLLGAGGTCSAGICQCTCTGSTEDTCYCQCGY